MKATEFIDPIIEEQLVLCKNDMSQLDTLLGQYATMSATSNQQMIEYYSD